MIELARHTPWAGLDKLDAKTVNTASDAIIESGLDWTVESRKLFFDTPSGQKVAIDNRRAIVRTSDDEPLGLVSNGYVPFQNREAFEFADELVEKGDAVFESAGSLRGGKVVFVTMKLAEQVVVADSDAHDMYILLRTSHDGSKAISVYVTPIRVFCMNQMAAVIKTAKHKWSMQHTGSLKGKIAEAKQTLAMSLDYAHEFAELGTTLAGTKLTDDKFFDIVTGLIPVRPKTDEIVEQIMGLYRESPTNGYNGTAWGGLNAITEYFDHYRATRSSEAVFMNIMDGGIANIRNNATQQLLALA